MPIAPQSKSGGKGKITFGLNLVGAHGSHGLDYILSEGETRIAALAAFLADTTGSNQLAPFIFDDPISSLDQDFEERVVERLVCLISDAAGHHFYSQALSSVIGRRGDGKMEQDARDAIRQADPDLA